MQILLLSKKKVKSIDLKLMQYFLLENQFSTFFIAKKKQKIIIQTDIKLVWHNNTEQVVL